jgi:hypothetical protein
MCKKMFWFCAVALILAISMPSWADIVSDDFNTPRNYLTAAFPVGIWDGKIGNWPTANSESAWFIQASGPNAPGALFLASNASQDTSWENEPLVPDRPRGPFLYRNVKSNYWIMQVKIVGGNTVAWNLAGLHARAKFIPTAGGGTTDEGGTGEDTEGFGQFRVNGYNDTRVQSLDDGDQVIDAGSGGLRPYVRITQDVNSKGDPNYYFDSSWDGLVWQRQNSPRSRPDLKGLELQLGINQAQYNTEDANMWFDNFLLMYQGPGQAWPLLPEYQASNVDPRPFFSWVPGNAQAVNGHRIYIDTNSAKVTNRTADMNYIRTEPNYTVLTPTLLMPLTRYYWAVDEINGVITAGDVWSFVTEAAAATGPQPADSAGGVLIGLAQVSWIPYEYATAQKIYFSKTFQDVNGPGVGGVNLGAAVTSYNSFTKPLDVQTDYYWRIDTTVGANTYRGSIWRFTTAFPMNFCDPFNPGWDYYVNGVGGTIWNGVIGEPQLYVMNTDTTPGKLRIEESGYWSGRYGQGVMLYKEVDGPYIATVEVTNLNGMPTGTGQIFGQRAGLIARLPDLRWGRFGNDPDTDDEDWVGMWFYPTYNVGNMGNVQGWHWNTGTQSTQGNNTIREFGIMWTGWPTNPNPTGAPNLANASGRFLMIDYKGHGTGSDPTQGGRFWLRWSQNGSTWFTMNSGSQPTNNGRQITVAPLNRYGDMNNYPHQVGVALSGPSLGFAEFENFCLGRELQAKASGPSPATGGSTDIMKAELQWAPGDLALDQDLYYGTSETAVRDANRTSPEYRGNAGDGIYSGLGTPDPYTGMYSRYAYDVVAQEPLVLGTTYYWRVDEVNSPTIWKGDVWSFVLLSYSVVDNFERFASTGGPGTLTSLRATWLDGYIGVGYTSWQYPNPPDPIGSSGSYAQVSNDTADGNTMTTNATLGGGKSLKLYYDNDGSVAWLITLYGGQAWQYYPAPMYSEVSAAVDNDARIDDVSRNLYIEDQGSLEMQRDWTDYSILRIGYHGGITNTKLNAKDKMYVGLKDSDGTLVIMNNPDTDAVLHQGWHNWYIALKDFNTANPALDMTNIARVYLGVGDRSAPASGGRGAIFVDEIQLLTGTICAMPNPGNTELSSVAGDFSSDCRTNATDMQRMTEAWLGQAYSPNVVPTPPIIQLDAATGVTTVGGKVTNWQSTGSLPGGLNFVDFNTPQTGYRPTLMANVEGKQAVWFDGNDVMIADINTPLVITGNHAWTVIATIYRDGSQATSFDTEYFVWGKRNTALRQGAATYSANTYGSFAGWGGTDKGWTRYFPPLHQWHKLAITFAGGTNGTFYAISDGQVNTISTLAGADIWKDPYGNGLLMTLGAAYDGDSALTRKITLNTATPLMGAIAKLEVYDYYMTSGQLIFLMGTPLDMSVDADNIINFKDIAVFANSWMALDLLGD